MPFKTLVRTREEGWEFASWGGSLGDGEGDTGWVNSACPTAKSAQSCFFILKKILLFGCGAVQPNNKIAIVAAAWTGTAAHVAWPNAALV